MNKLTKIEKIMLESSLVILLYFLRIFIFEVLFNINEIGFNNNIKYTIELLSYIIFSILVGCIYLGDLDKYLIKFKNNIRKNIGSIMITSLITILIFLINLIIIVLTKNTIFIHNIESIRLINKFPIQIGMLLLIIIPVITSVVMKKTLIKTFRNKWVFSIVSSLLLYISIILFHEISIGTILTSNYILQISFIGSYKYYETNDINYPIIINIMLNIFILLTGNLLNLF